MAFIKKSGSRFQVRQGNNNKLIVSVSSRAKAEKKVAMLHKKFNPKVSNRGKNAAKRFRK